MAEVRKKEKKEKYDIDEIKKDMIRYSIATIFFIVFCALFFYAVDIIFALIQSIFR